MTFHEWCIIYKARMRDYGRDDFDLIFTDKVKDIAYDAWNAALMYGVETKPESEVEDA